MVQLWIYRGGSGVEEDEMRRVGEGAGSLERNIQYSMFSVQFSTSISPKGYYRNGTKFAEMIEN